MFHINATPQLTMLSRPSVTFHNDENAMASFRVRTKLGGNDSKGLSNAKLKRTPFAKSSILNVNNCPGGLSFTPKNSSRKALGDISNRKGPKPNGKGNGPLNKSTKGKIAQVSFVPFSTLNNGNTGRGAGYFDRNNQNVRKEPLLPLRTGLSTSHQIQSEVNTSKLKQVMKPIAQKDVIISTNHNLACTDYVEDVERPAGRMWDDQTESDHDFNYSIECHDISDDLTGISEVSMITRRQENAQILIDKEIEELAKIDLEVPELIEDLESSMNVLEDDLDLGFQWENLDISDDISL